MKGMMRSAVISVKKGGLYAGIMLLSDTIGSAVGSIILWRNMFHYFTLFTLVEAAVFFLIGGAVDIGGSLSFRRIMDHVSKKEGAWSTEAHRQAQSRAFPFVVTGIILLVLSFILAYPLN
jgi:hypothetical protein